MSVTVSTGQQPDESNVRLHPGVIWRTAVMLVLMMANSYYGKYRLDEFQTTTKQGPTVGLVQINLPQTIKNTDPKTTWDHVWLATRPFATTNVDFVVWPETCYPWPFGSIDNTVTDDQLVEAFTKLGQARLAPGQTHAEFAKAVRDADHENTKGMAEVAQQLKRPIVASAILYSVAPGRYDQYNSSVAVDPKQGIVGIYNKRHLVPFGEYVPFMRFLDLVRFLLPYENGIVPMMTHGDQARILTIGPWKLGCLICFEDTLPAEAQAFFVPARKGPVPAEERSLVPDILVNQSNDGWFRGSIESDYHLAAAIFRTIETRRPMLRAANMAYTAYVDSAGRVVNKLPKLEVGQLIAEVTLDSRVAPYIALGDWLPLGCLVIVGVALLARLMSFRRSPREQTVQQG